MSGDIEEGKSDETTIVEKFKALLDEVTVSKESILRVTKYVMEFPTPCQAYIDIVRDKVKQIIPKRRLAFVYLLDSFAQNAKKTQNEEIVQKAGYAMREVISFALDPSAISNAGVDNISSIEKVVTLWKARDIFSTEVVREVTAVIEGVKAARGASRLTPDEEKILKKIEEIRREQKLKQIENALRPVNDTLEAQVMEFFSSFPPQEKLLSIWNVYRLEDDQSLSQVTSIPQPQMVPAPNQPSTNPPNTPKSSGSPNGNTMTVYSPPKMDHPSPSSYRNYRPEERPSSDRNLRNSRESMMQRPSSQQRTRTSDERGYYSSYRDHRHESGSRESMSRDHHHHHSSSSLSHHQHHSYSRGDYRDPSSSHSSRSSRELHSSRDSMSSREREMHMSSRDHYGREIMSHRESHREPHREPHRESHREPIREHRDSRSMSRGDPYSHPSMRDSRDYHHSSSSRHRSNSDQYSSSREKKYR